MKKVLTDKKHGNVRRISVFRKLEMSSGRGIIRKDNGAAAGGVVLLILICFQCRKAGAA